MYCYVFTCNVSFHHVRQLFICWYRLSDKALEHVVIMRTQYVRIVLLLLSWALHRTEASKQKGFCKLVTILYD